MAGGDYFPSFSEERRIIDGECHRRGRLVDSDAGKGFGVGVEGDGIPDLEVSRPTMAQMFLRSRPPALFPGPMPSKSMELLDFLACHTAIFLAESHFHAFRG